MAAVQSDRRIASDVVESLWLDHPTPDFDEFRRVMTGEQTPRRVHLAEASMDGEIMQAITESAGETWQSLGGGFEMTPPEPYYAQVVRVYYHLGYDCAPVWATWPGHPSPHHRVTDNTAEMAADDRHWVEEGFGLIRSWKDFEAFPWDALQPDPRPVEYAAKHLPPGMKLTVNTTFFEHVFENLLGFEGLAYMLYDEPELVRAVFQRWGEKVLSYYQAVIGHEAVGAIFHADDMGFKTSTLIAASTLRELVLPWHKRYAALAHEHGKLFFIHSCGNLFKSGIIDDLIDDVRIDAYHSFQDLILPVADFKARYGRRVGTLGGVDMDKLVTLPEDELRPYLRGILDACVPGGRFAMGTGNTVANYIPVEHFAVLIDECRRWAPHTNR